MTFLHLLSHDQKCALQISDKAVLLLKLLSAGVSELDDREWSFSSFISKTRQSTTDTRGVNWSGGLRIKSSDSADYFHPLSIPPPTPPSFPHHFQPLPATNFQTSNLRNCEFFCRKVSDRHRWSAYVGCVIYIPKEGFWCVWGPSLKIFHQRERERERERKKSGGLTIHSSGDGTDI